MDADGALVLIVMVLMTLMAWTKTMIANRMISLARAPEATSRTPLVLLVLLVEYELPLRPRKRSGSRAGVLCGFRLRKVTNAKVRPGQGAGNWVQIVGGVPAAVGACEPVIVVMVAMAGAEAGCKNNVESLSTGSAAECGMCGVCSWQSC